jgi:hypothetical protein
MAQFNEISEGGLNQILNRRLAMEGYSPSPTLAPEVMPGLVLESDRPEWGFLKGEQLLGFSQSLGAGGAGAFGQAWFTNPTGSNTICVIERVSAHTTGNHAIIRIARSVDAGAIVGTLQNNTWRDTRWAIPGVLQVRTVITTLPALTYRTLAQATPSFPYDEPIVLGPGTTCHIYGETAATAFAFSCAWTERVALRGELV